MVFSSYHVTSCNRRNKNYHRPIEEIQSASSDSMPEIVMNYQLHQPPKTFKFPETVYGKQKPKTTIGLKITQDWTMMPKNVQWLVFFANGKIHICFQRDLRRKNFSKQVTETSKKTLKSLTSTSRLNVRSLPLHMKW